jgi:hypothetical protein
VLVGGSKCVLGADGGCEGRLEWHHAIKQQRLKRQFPFGALACYSAITDATGQRWMCADRYEEGCDLSLDDILGDTRNRIWLCSHHHELVTNGRVEAPLPDSVWIFAKEFGLEGMLDNDIARRARV